MKTIVLPVYDIVVEIDGAGNGRIISSLKEDVEDDDENFFYAMEAIESMVLGHACAGVDIESPAYLEGLETAVEACSNNI